MKEYTRRELIKLSILQFLAISASLPMMAENAQRVNSMGGITRSKTGISWDSFLSQVAVKARVADSFYWDEENYVKGIESLVRKLNRRDKSLLGALQHEAAIDAEPLSFIDLHKVIDFQVTLITFQRGEEIPHHNHPAMTGVLTCAVGSLAVEEYDFVDHLSASEVTLRQLNSRSMSAGNVSTLTARHRNVHSVRATEFAQVIDILTPAYDQARKSSTEWYSILGPAGSDNTLFAASRRVAG